MTGTLKLRFKLSTSSQARRYDIPICLPASEIEPYLSIISSSLTVRELLDELAGEMGRTLEQEEVHIAYGDRTWTLKAE
jgi:hypothetical protein